MKHDIFLFFLSTATWDRNTNDIRSTDYDGIGRCYATNESAVRYLCQKGVRFERMFYFETQAVQNSMNMPGHTETHLAFFQQRLKDILPEIKALLVPVHYDEQAGVDSMMNNVLIMSERIQSFARELPAGDTIVLHVDYTGGMRHTNLMMLDVLRLLQYNGIVIGSILYSDYNTGKVEDLRDVYNLFDLVSGAEEFANFGSVEAIQKYFQGRTVSKALQGLLLSMRFFSNEMRLCHRGRFLSAVQALRKNLLAFRTAKAPGISDRLMRALETRIASDYHEILQEDVNDLVLIRWCLRRGALQQALTLYVEAVPELLMDEAHGIVRLTEKGRDVIEKARTDRRAPETPAFFALTKYAPKNKEEGYDAQVQRLAKGDALRKELLKVWKTAFQTLQQGNDIDVQAIKAHIASRCQTLPDFSPWHMDRALQHLAILQQWKEQPALLKGESEAPDTCWLEHEIMSRMHKRTGWNPSPYGKKNLGDMLKFLCFQATEEDICLIFSDFGYEYAARFLSYVDEGLAELACPREDFRAALNAYGALKKERNSSNHARPDIDEQVLGADELKAAIEESLAAIEHLRT